MTRRQNPQASNPTHNGQLTTVGIAGAGLMGRQIAAVCLERGVSVTLFDTSAASLEKAVLDLGRESAGATGGRLAVAESIRALGVCDVLVETVVEDEAVKQAVLSELEAVAGAASVIVSNTSSFSITRLATVLRRPGRFCGLHFCHPLRERRLAEVVPGEQTSVTTRDAACRFAKRLRRVPLVVPDRPGFLLNRLLVPYLNAALELAADGVDLNQIEFVARRRGMPSGPFTFLDEVGLATALRVGASLFRQFPERIRPSGLLIALAKAGHLGHQSGAGLLLWTDGGRAVGVNPAVERLIAGSHPTSLRTEVIEDRLFLPLADEVAVALQDGTARSVGVVAAALRHGVGFRGSLPNPHDAGRLVAA